jgi:hypothetical protein
LFRAKFLISDKIKEMIITEISVLIAGVVFGVLVGSPVIYFSLVKPVQLKPPDQARRQIIVTSYADRTIGKDLKECRTKKIKL